MLGNWRELRKFFHVTIVLSALLAGLVRSALIFMSREKISTVYGVLKMEQEQEIEFLKKENRELRERLSQLEYDFCMLVLNYDRSKETLNHIRTHYPLIWEDIVAEM